MEHEGYHKSETLGAACNAVSLAIVEELARTYYLPWDLLSRALQESLSEVPDFLGGEKGWNALSSEERRRIAEQHLEEPYPHLDAEYQTSDGSAIVAEEIDLLLPSERHSNEQSLDRWKPCFIGDRVKFGLNTEQKRRLLAISRCPASARGAFIRRLERAAKSYLGMQQALRREKPAVVRRKLKRLNRARNRKRALAKLPHTADFLVRRYGQTEAIVRANNWLGEGERRLKYALIDFPKRALLFEIAWALEEVANVKLTAKRGDAFSECALIMLGAVGALRPKRVNDRLVEPAEDIRRSLRTALTLLSNSIGRARR